MLNMHVSCCSAWLTRPKGKCAPLVASDHPADLAAGGGADTQARLLLWSVERTIAGLSDLAQHGETRALRAVTRPSSASPAAGTAKKHAQEQADLISRAFDR